MDADTVRLILLVVGVVFLLGLYLWERSRDPEEADEDEVYGEDDTPYGAGPRTLGGAKREPTLGLAEAGVDGKRRLLVPDRAPGKAPDRSEEIERDPEAVWTSEYGSGEDLDVAGDAPLLIQLSVAKRYGEMTGPEILEAAESCGLHPGEMDIFHCLDEFDDGTRTYFSMANMVKPGTFPFDDMDTFTTPGMMLFAQLEGHPEDLTILDEMIATARKLATTLGGDVLDDTRRPLTVRKEEDMRNAVLANEARFARLGR